MSVFKATKNKKNINENETFKATTRKSFDTSMVYGWETRNRESSAILQKYQKSVSGGGFLTDDELTNYKKALDEYIDTSNHLLKLNHNTMGLSVNLENVV